MSDKTARLRAEVQGVAIYIALHERSADETTLTPRGMQRLDSALDAYMGRLEQIAILKTIVAYGVSWHEAEAALVAAEAEE